MTHEERFEKIEQKLEQISDMLSVTAELQRRSDDRFENEREAVWAAFKATTDRLSATADQLSTTADQLSVLQTGLLSLQATVDRFIKAQGGNGHGSTK